jgi:hypothetical protein
MYVLFCITKFAPDSSSLAWIIFDMLPYIYYPFGAIASILFILAVVFHISEVKH